MKRARVFAAFARVALAAEPIHRDRERLVRFGRIEPKLIAPVQKRFTISLAGSTSSSGSGCRRCLELEQAAQRHRLRASSLMCSANCR